MGWLSDIWDTATQPEVLGAGAAALARAEGKGDLATLRGDVGTLAGQARENLAGFGVGEYNQGILVNRPSVNASSGGGVVQLGVEVTINGSPISVQRITAQAVLGRVI